jgi:hypothetical protein
MQYLPKDSCEESDCQKLAQQEQKAQAKPRTKSKSRGPKLIVPDLMGLSDNDLKRLITGWVVPRLIVEFVAEMNASQANPTANKSVAVEEQAGNKAA